LVGTSSGDIQIFDFNGNFQVIWVTGKSSLSKKYESILIGRYFLVYKSLRNLNNKFYIFKEELENRLSRFSGSSFGSH